MDIGGRARNWRNGCNKGTAMSDPAYALPAAGAIERALEEGSELRRSSKKPQLWHVESKKDHRMA
jgi:hypothetical protein